MKTNRVKTNIMNTNVRHGMTILGLGALLFGATAMVPAHADNRHRDRDHDRATFNVQVDLGHVNTDLVFYSGPDRRPAGPFWYYDNHDRCWRRDRCR